jgi:hypothetical protein
MITGFWGLVVEPGQVYSQIVDSSFRITNVVLDPKTDNSKIKNGRVSLSVNVGNVDYVLATVLPGSQEQQMIDVTFSEGMLLASFIILIIKEYLYLIMSPNGI